MSSPSFSRHLDKITAILIAFLFCLWGFGTISQYGVTWDFNNWFKRGEAYLSFYLYGRTNFDGLGESEQCPFQENTFEDLVYNDKSAFNEGGHPPLGAILSGIGCEIFYKKLRWLGPVDAHHSMLILFGGLSIWILYLFSSEVYGPAVGVASAFFLAVFPRFIAHSHNNIKDLPIVWFFIFAIYTFRKGVSRKNLWWFILSACFWGLSLSTKLTALYLPAILLPWFFVYDRANRDKSKASTTTFTVAALSYPIVAVTVFVLLWPYLWTNTGEHIKKFTGFYKFISSSAVERDGVTPSSRPYVPYSIVYSIITTPLPMLGLLFLGLKDRKKHFKFETDRISLLFFLWLSAPIFLTSLPGIRIYNGIRQFMHYIPALCVFCGIGLVRAYEWVKDHFRNRMRQGRIAAQVMAGLLVVQSIFWLWLYHPYEITYFSGLVGGLPGAQKLGVPDATDYWAHSYRNGVRWINRNAAADSLLCIPFGEHLVGLLQDLRPDIRICTFEDIQNIYPQKKAYIMYVTKNSWYNYITDYCDEYLNPIHKIEVLGAPVLKIYSYEKQ